MMDDALLIVSTIVTLFSCPGHGLNFSKVCRAFKIVTLLTGSLSRYISAGFSSFLLFFSILSMAHRMGVGG